MPDWSYRPLLKPLLFSLSPKTGRDVTLTAIGGLGETPFGPPLIDFLGHMRAPIALQRDLMGLRFGSPVGLGAGLDPGARAIAALSRFGFGFVEAGPVTVARIGEGRIDRESGTRSISYEQPLANPGADHILPRLAKLQLTMPLGIRVCADPEGAIDSALEALFGVVGKASRVGDYVVVQIRRDVEPAAAPWSDLAAAAGAACPLLVAIPPGVGRDELEATVGRALDAGFGGLVIAGGTHVGEATRPASLEGVRIVRSVWGTRPVVIASGGVEEPGHALAYLDAGADLVQIHSGLVFSGPGLPKRINEALLHRAGVTSGGAAVLGGATEPLARGGGTADAEGTARGSAPADVAHGLTQRTWIGHLLVGITMVVSGLAACVVAATSVVLPYDTAFLGISRAELASINPRLLPFLTHDRISLAGVMVSIGALFIGLTWHGIRRRVHWASRAVVMSTAVGFASFFLFLVYGYFDVLHAALSLLILVFFAVGLRWRADGPPQVPVADLVDDRSWRRSQVGQFAFVVLAVGLIGGGIRIAFLGSTSVLVPEDLEFMSVTAEALAAANPRLLSLIAHDRAGFGGALVSLGLAVLGVALWGFRRGARWVWWTLLVAALPGLLAVVAVHMAVGYEDFWHLAPVLLAIALTSAGLALSRAYMWEPSSR